MSTLQSDYRAAAVSLLTDYAASTTARLQVYRARPASINPPTAFVDSMAGGVTFTGPTLRQEVPTIEVVVIHGIFDSGEAVDQRDAFVDGFGDWCVTRYHEAGASTLLGLTAMNDDPAYVPDWLPLENQRTYYATRLTLEGLALH